MTPNATMPSRRAAAPAGAMRLLFLLAFPASVGIVVWRVPLSQNADGLLETIMSLQRLTLFYWGQSRFANILPLLASPIRNPVLNADAQLGARIVLGLLAPIFACALLSASEARLSVTRATLLSALLFLASAPNRIIEEALTQTSPFGTSFVLLGASVLALRRAEAAPAANGAARRWRAAGLALAVAAFLQNVSLALEAAPLAVGLCVLARSRVVVGFAVVSAIALLVTMLAMTLCAPAAAPHIGGFGKSLAGLRVYGGYLVGPPGLCLWAVLALAIAGHCLGRRDPAARVRRRGDLVLVATIAASFVATGLSDWVVSNGAHPRYLVPVYLLAASLGGLTVERMIRTFDAGRVRHECGAAAVAGILLALAIAHLGPVPAGSDRIIASPWARMSTTVASAVLSRHLDGVAGSYWDVWPAIFRLEQSGNGSLGFAENGSARRRAIVRLLRARGLRLGCIHRPGEDCAEAIGLTIDVPFRASEVADPAVMLDAGRRLSTLAVFALPAVAHRRRGVKRHAEPN